MPTTLGRPEKEGYEAPSSAAAAAAADEDTLSDFPQGDLVSIDLTGAFPATRVSKVD